ncbi:kinase-like domain-containing protein [Lipomyces oligophaga]|uniref:kinase-like domain-containing protein n=1 Tax=Lipomyces oligophaga TaxID=45792 RepID=UPI0034CECF97
MSIIPYDPAQSIVLYEPTQGALVLYDHESGQLSVHRDVSVSSSNASRPSPRFSPSDLCPFCGQRRPAATHNSGNSRPIWDDSIISSISDTTRILGGHLRDREDVNEQTQVYSESGRPYIDSEYFRLLHDQESVDYISDSSNILQNDFKIGISSSAYSEGYFNKFFRTERELGRGGRGTVYLVEHILDGFSLGHFACKKIPVGDDHTWLERVLREVNLMRLNHINLVNYNHVWLENSQMTQFGPSVPCIFILQEYCNGGTLEELIVKRSGDRSDSSWYIREVLRRRRSKSTEQTGETRTSFLSLEEIGSYFVDIISGLNHLHENGYIHRDLKSSNCLLNYDSSDRHDLARVLVSDFGEGQRFGTKREATGTTGTIGYAAPETLQPDVDSGELSEFSFKSDMFSLGMILYYMCFAKLPYEHDFDYEFDQLKDEVKSWSGFDRNSVQSIRSDLPQEIYTLLSDLLSPNPDDRPSADTILELIGAKATSRSRRSSGTVATSSATLSSKLTSGRYGSISQWEQFRSSGSSAERTAVIESLSIIPQTNHVSSSSELNIKPGSEPPKISHERYASALIVGTGDSKQAVNYNLSSGTDRQLFASIISYSIVALLSSVTTYYYLSRFHS